MGTPASSFFMSYSREDVNYQKRVISELRQHGLSVWVDTENLIPGSPAWEREIERAIRSASGIIVLLSPAANNSEWVRREISFAEQNNKRIFPVLIHGDEDDSIPLRLSSHQRVDLRRNFNDGLRELENALQEHLGVTAVQKIPKQGKAAPSKPVDLQKFILPGILAALGLLCLGGMGLGINYLFKNFPAPSGTPLGRVTATNTLPDADPVITDTSVPNPTTPTGRIVYTCQLEGDEICIMNADGSGVKRLTDTQFANGSANLSPDGKSVIFISKDDDISEIHEINLDTGKTKHLTDLGVLLSSPEISPDNKYILFTYRSGIQNSRLWIMNRDGSDPHEFYSSSGKDTHDGAWSPDGTQIVFALGRGDNNQLYTLGSDGRDTHLINSTIDTRGHSDWSLGNLITFDMGGPFMHDIYIMNLDGSNLHKLSKGDNAQGETFSPDGQWIAYTAYTDVANKNTASCEIYIMRIDGSGPLRLTNNNFCDYQPRWGN
jgi:Tol biopolymer transport system component